MKKILIVSLIALLISSCGEIYKEERGKVFEGTWALSRSFSYSSEIKENTPPINETNGNRFIIARKCEGENFLLFYSKGTYDSSFFYRLQDSILFVRKIADSIDVKISGKDSVGIVKIPQKPLDPKAEYAPEKCYGVFTFSEGARLIMTVKRYALTPKGALDKNTLLYEDIYERPDDDI